MPPTLNVRPTRINLLYDDRAPIVLTFTFPASYLSSRTFKSFLNGRGDDGIEATCTEGGGNVLTVEFAADDLQTLTEGPAYWELDLFDDPDYTPYFAGTWTPGTGGTPSPTTGDFTVTTPQQVNVIVTTNLPGADGVVAELVEGPNITIDSSDPAAPIITASAGSATAINAQTGTSYTTVLGDANKMVTMSNVAANTFTVPPNASVAYPVGAVLTVAQLGAGQTTITPGVGVTINAFPGLDLDAQYSVASIMKLATDTWLAFGSLEA